MPPSVPQPSVVFQGLVDQQGAAFSDLTQKQLRAMATQDDNELWRNFNDAYSLGLKHVLELASRIRRHASHN